MSATIWCTLSRTSSPISSTLNHVLPNGFGVGSKTLMLGKIIALYHSTLLSVATHGSYSLSHQRTGYHVLTLVLATEVRTRVTTGSKCPPATATAAATTTTVSPSAKTRRVGVKQLQVTLAPEHPTPVPIAIRPMASPTRHTVSPQRT